MGFPPHLFSGCKHILPGSKKFCHANAQMKMVQLNISFKQCTPFPAASPPPAIIATCMHRLVSSGHGISKHWCFLVFAFVRTHCNNPSGMRWSCFGLGSCSRHAHTSTYRHVLWKTSMDTMLGSRRAPTTMWQQREGCVRFAARDKDRCATTISVPMPRIQGI